MARIKLPPTFAARVKSVHHPAPPPNSKRIPSAASISTPHGTAQTTSSQTAPSTTSSADSTDPSTLPASPSTASTTLTPPTTLLPPYPHKSPNPGVAVALTRGRKWNHKVQKYFLYPKSIKVSDPTAALRVGDTILCTRWPSLSNSKTVEHTVAEIIKAQGADLAGRNKVWTEEERRAWRVGRLMEEGSEATRKRIREGKIVIGEEGEIVMVGEKSRRGGREVGESVEID